MVGGNYRLNLAMLYNPLLEHEELAPFHTQHLILYGLLWSKLTHRPLPRMCTYLLGCDCPISLCKVTVEGKQMKWNDVKVHI